MAFRHFRKLHRQRKAELRNGAEPRNELEMEYKHQKELQAFRGLDGSRQSRNDGGYSRQNGDISAERRDQDHDRRQDENARRADRYERSHHRQGENWPRASDRHEDFRRRSGEHERRVHDRQEDSRHVGRYQYHRPDYRRDDARSYGRDRRDFDEGPHSQNGDAYRDSRRRHDDHRRPRSRESMRDQPESYRSRHQQPHRSADQGQQSASTASKRPGSPMPTSSTSKVCTPSSRSRLDRPSQKTMRSVIIHEPPVPDANGFQTGDVGHKMPGDSGTANDFTRITPKSIMKPSGISVGSQESGHPCDVEESPLGVNQPLEMAPGDLTTATESEVHQHTDADMPLQMENADVLQMDDQAQSPIETCCTCGRAEYGEMVFCANPGCEIVRFHLACTELDKVPDADASWYCGDCKDAFEEDSDAEFQLSNPPKEGDLSVAYQQKVARAQQDVAQLRQIQCRLEDQAKQGYLFGSPLVQVIELFRKFENERPEIKRDPNMANPMRDCQPFPDGLFVSADYDFLPMSLNDWLMLEPGCWLDDCTISNIVIDRPRDVEAHGYYCVPSLIYHWLSSELRHEEKLQRIQTCIASAKRTGAMPFSDDGKHALYTDHWPAQNMPRETKIMVFPYNSNSHWITVKLEPNWDGEEGVITFFDSGGYRNVEKQVRELMPMFAELVSLRPGLDWPQNTWIVRKGQTSLQLNDSDCGPITADNCHHLLVGEDPVVMDRSLVEEYGQMIRYEALCRLFHRLSGDSITTTAPSKPQAAAAASNNSPAASDHRTADDPPNSFLEQAQVEQDSDEAGSDEEPLDESILEQKCLREVLCSALESNGESALLDLVEAVRLALPEMFSDTQDVERIVKKVMVSTDSMFDCSWQGTKQLWRVMPGPGRSLSTSTKRRLMCSKPISSAEEMLHLLFAPCDVILSTVRTSKGARSRNARMKDNARCEALIKAYWQQFRKESPLPAEWKAGDEGVPSTPCWIRHHVQDRSSRESILQNGRYTDKHVRKLLEGMHGRAQRSGEPIRLLLLGNGWDGLTTNNFWWDELRRKFPYFEMYICLAVPKAKLPTGSFVIDHGTMWATYAVNDLVRVRQGRHPCEVGSAGAQALQCIRTHYEQFLFLLQTIDCSKLDRSLRSSETLEIILPDARFDFVTPSRLALRLVQQQRNRFLLGFHGKPSDGPSDKTSDKVIECRSGSGGISHVTQPCEVEGCPFVSIRLRRLKESLNAHFSSAHVDLVDPSASTIPCPECPCRVRSKIILGKHISMWHSAKLQRLAPPCPMPSCPERYHRSQSRIIKHIAAAHEGHIPCPHDEGCVCKLDSQESLKCHLKYHGKSRMPESEMQRHQEKVEEIPRRLIVKLPVTTVPTVPTVRSRKRYNVRWKPVWTGPRTNGKPRQTAKP